MISIEKLAMTTYDGLVSMTGVSGYRLDKTRMIKARRNDNSIQLRCEQMGFLNAAHHAFKNMDYGKLNELLESIFANIRKDIDPRGAFEMGVSMLGGRLIPKDTEYMAMDL